MLISAEVRWFWPANPPEGLKDWFCNAHESYCCAGGGELRVDEYLRDSRQVELGVKRRGGKLGVEVKGLTSVIWGGLTIAPFVGPIELWCKWTSEQLELKPDMTITTRKTRWLRKFDASTSRPQEIPLDSKEQRLDMKPLPALGCNVELTQVMLPNDEIWWTLGFEAFGTIRTVEHDLRAVATVMADRRPPEIKGGIASSYPAWLSERACQ